jgi:hypothetical protein
MAAAPSLSPYHKKNIQYGLVLASSAKSQEAPEKNGLFAILMNRC